MQSCLTDASGLCDGRHIKLIKIDTVDGQNAEEKTPARLGQDAALVQNRLALLVEEDGLAATE